jgi:hypothetical protein
MKPIRVMLAFLLLLITSSVALADINQFSGKWKNVDPKTRGLTTLQIDVKGTRVRIQAFGSCHPSDCAWGYAEGTAYAPSVESSLSEAAQAISTIYLTSFSQIILIIRPTEDGQIEVEMLTKFTDQSGRANTRRVERLSRGEVADAKR